jgi:hypothetical protein
MDDGPKKSAAPAILDEQAQLLKREQEAKHQQEREQLQRIQEEERSRQERFHNLLDRTYDSDKDRALEAMQLILQEAEEDDQAQREVHQREVHPIGISRQECIHFQHITKFMAGKSFEQMTELVHDKILALMGRFPNDYSYVIGITTDPHRRFYTADFSYRRVFGQAAKTMYILLKCSATEAKNYETRLIQVCRLNGPRGILNIKNGGEGLSELNPHEAYVYIVIRSTLSI